jgi:hypothetical protein
MIAFCLGLTLIMWVFHISGIVEKKRVLYTGKESSKKLSTMNEEEYKNFLVAAPAYAGIPARGEGRLCLKPEATSDFVRYLTNEHSQLAMLFADPLHPYSINERLCAFFILNSIMLMLLMFAASGILFNTTREPTRNELMVYNFCVLSPAKVVVAFIEYIIFCAPFDRKFTPEARKKVNIIGHVLMFLMVGAAFYCLWEASMVIRIANDELQENLPSYIYSVLISSNLIETLMIYLKFVDLSEKSKLPEVIRLSLIFVHKVTWGLLRIGEWDRQHMAECQSTDAMDVELTGIYPEKSSNGDPSSGSTQLDSPVPTQEEDQL